MPEQTLVISRQIDAPVTHVWDVLTDLPQLAGRLSGITSIHIMTSGPYAVGSRWRETRTLFGMSATEEMWVRRNNPMRSTVIEASSKGTDYCTTWELTPAAVPLAAGPDAAGTTDTRRESTELSVTFSARPSNGAESTVLATLFGVVGLRATRKALEQDLDDIAAAVAALTSA